MSITEADIREAWRRWDGEKLMTPEQTNLLMLENGTGERLMTPDELKTGRKAQAETPPKPARQTPAPQPPRPFAPVSEIGKSLLADDPGMAELLRKSPTRDEMYELIEALKDRIEQLEKSGARFRGVYQRASSYRLGDQATHKGSLWTALQDVPEGTLPGESPAHWQLSAKGVL